jgi:hypothetical protein
MPLILAGKAASDHKTLDRGTLRSILRSVGLTAGQFRELL